jgi:hypothetical protein
MNSLYPLIGFTVLMGGLLIEALIFRALYAYPPSMSKLLAIRHKLFLLLIVDEVDRNEPYLAATYRSVNTLIAAYRRSREPAERLLAEMEVEQVAYILEGCTELAELPREVLPISLRPIMLELRDVLEHIVDHRFRVDFILNKERRESARMQRAMATALLKMMPNTMAHAA